MPQKKLGTRTLIGWDEFCAFPDLGLPAVRAKIDTGAKTTAMHAYDIQPFKKEGQNFVRFKTCPIKNDKNLIIECVAPLADKRRITSSNGEKETRYVIRTALIIGEKKLKTEISLTSRDRMQFRMLLGRDDLKRAKFLVDPRKSCLWNKMTIDEQRDLYKEHDNKQGDK